MEKQIIISNIIESGTAFGFVADTGEQVFIPSNVMKASNAELFVPVAAVLVPNNYQSERTPWLAAVIKSDSPTPAPVPGSKERDPASAMAERDQRILDALEPFTYAVTSEIAEATGIDPKSANNSLNRLFAAGKIAKADVHGSPDQSRASVVLWALDAKRFLEAS